jgi:hypothetical protein
MSVPNLAQPATSPTGESLLDDIDYRVRLTQEGPQPLAVDGRRLGHGLPGRPIALTELSAILMHPSCRPAAQNAVWRLLVLNARTGREAWMVGAVFVALPGLRRRAYLLSRLSDGDVEAAIVEAFIHVLRTAKLARVGVLNGLLNAAFTQARASLTKRDAAASAGVVNGAAGSRQPTGPAGHPDLVLARAVRHGVLTVEEAALVGGTYLEDVTAGQYAERVGQSQWLLYKQRSAAVQRLVAALRGGQLSDPYDEVVQEATGVLTVEDSGRKTRP